MSEDYRVTLLNLKELSALDAKIAGIKSQRKQLQNQIIEKQKLVDNAKHLAAQKINAHRSKRKDSEEKESFLKAERNKLADRRKALQSLQNHKLIQAAEREIDATGRQLNAQEEVLLEEFEQIDILAKSESEASAALELAQKDLAALQAEAQETFATLDEREAAASDDRAAAAANISPGSMAIYKRVSEKYVSDAIVAFKNNSCSGCFLNLGPQVTLEISRGTGLIKCRGCGRILFLAKAED